MPAAAAVEELSSARTQEVKDVLEVRGGARGGAEPGRIERASPHGEEEEARDAAADLEATRADVLARHTVAREVKNRPEKECSESRSAGGTGRGSCRHVERDDHGCLPNR